MSHSLKNHAAWLMAKQDPVFQIKEAPFPTPGPSEIVIKTTAIALNPADHKLQSLGILIPSYPAILGCDVAGTIYSLGSSIPSNEFQIGDRVIGSCQPTKPVEGVYRYSAFQEYVVLSLPLVAKVPEGVKDEEAVVLPLGVVAASSCLFHQTTLGLDLPSLGEEGNAEKGVLIVWGASSSVGSCGVQLATKAGYEVWGVASEKNHEICKRAGAKEMFDQKDPILVGKVVAKLKGKKSVGAYDAVSKAETLGALCDILHEAGGRKVVAAIAPGADKLAKHDVSIKLNFAIAGDYNSTVGPKIFRGFLEPALKEGEFLCLPPADVVGHSLEDLQKGCDFLAKGVSAKKVVISMA